MASSTVVITPFLPIIIFVGIALILTIVAVFSAYRKNIPSPSPSPPQRYRNTRQRYVPGEFSHQMELDLRLPYRRFKQLYPSSTLTYEDYKTLQMQRSFRRSMSNQENKRMVR